MTTAVDRPTPLVTTRPVWPRTHRAVVLGLAALTMVAEVASLATDTRVHIGSIPLSWSLVPSLLVLLALGPRSNGRGDVDVTRLVPFWLGIAGAYLFGWALWSKTGDAASVAGVSVAAINEEVVYRFAVPLVLTTALLLLRMPTTPARVVGYVVAGWWWVLLPGHRAQTDSLMMLATFVVFAIASALIVSRSRALLPMALAHGALNIITISQLRGDIEPGVRGVLAACLVFLLVGTYAWPGDHEARQEAAVDGDGSMDDLVGDAVIDLRDGFRPSVARDGAVTYLDEEPGAPIPPVAEPVADGLDVVELTGDVPAASGDTPV